MSDFPSQPNCTHTPTPWRWVIHDASAATLCGPNSAGRHDGIEGHVLSMSPCKSCYEGQDEWLWGRCTTSSEQDAAFIVEAVNSHASLKAHIEELEKALQKIADQPDHGSPQTPIKRTPRQIAITALKGAA